MGDLNITYVGWVMHMGGRLKRGPLQLMKWLRERDLATFAILEKDHSYVLQILSWISTPGGLFFIWWEFQFSRPTVPHPTFGVLTNISWLQKLPGSKSVLIKCVQISEEEP